VLLYLHKKLKAKSTEVETPTKDEKAELA